MRMGAMMGRRRRGEERGYMESKESERKKGMYGRNGGVGRGAVRVPEIRMMEMMMAIRGTSTVVCREPRRKTIAWIVTSGMSSSFALLLIRPGCSAAADIQGSSAMGGTRRTRTRRTRRIRT
jgi:hypothetical protein